MKYRFSQWWANCQVALGITRRTSTGGSRRKHDYKEKAQGRTREGRKAIRVKDVTAGTIAFWDVLWRMRKWVNYKEAQALYDAYLELTARKVDCSALQLRRDALCGLPF
jgi:hypothetical protein